MSTAPTRPKKIKALISIENLADGNLTPLLDASLQGLTDHSAIYSQPPIDLATYAAGINAFKAALAAALDGSKSAIAQKNNLRHAAIKMYVVNAHYVEANCNENMATFLLSGYQPASTVKAPPQPLPQPVINSVVQGPNSGQLKVTIGSLPKALSFLLRHGVATTGGGTPASWIEDTITSRKPVIVSDLTPGTMYVFQVRALGRLGYTDWSDPVSRMVT